jgi:protocatechuate 3,4-dioxygenase beta subunit
MTRTRRQLIRDATGLGVGAAAVGFFGCEEENEVADAASPSCTLTPEVTEGPYYLDLDKVRRNVTEGKHGLRLDLHTKVVDADTCKPHEDAAVEIWHCDARGTSSLCTGTTTSTAGAAGTTERAGDGSGLAEFMRATLRPARKRRLWPD